MRFLDSIYLLSLRHYSHQVKADNNCSKMDVIQCVPAAVNSPRMCSVLATLEGEPCIK